MKCKFKVGDKVKLKVKGEYNKTHQRYHVTPEMEEILYWKPYIVVEVILKEDKFKSKGFMWHPDDFVLYHSELKEGGKLL